MISLEVRRTLVKSPPELWTELSDPGRLAAHLGELGDIRIVRTDPEQVVEWEAQGTRGIVLIKPSGWGTKVTLTVLREMPEPEPEPPGVHESSAESEPPGVDEAFAEPGPPPMPVAFSLPEPPGMDEAFAESEPPGMHESSAEPEPPGVDEAFAEPGPPMPVAFSQPEPPVVDEDSAESEPLSMPAALSETEPPEKPPAPGREPELEARRGFFARLFGRRRIREARESDRSDSIEAAQPARETIVPTPDEAASAADELKASFDPAPQEGPVGAPATEAGRRPSHEEPATAALHSEADEAPTQQEPPITTDVPPEPVAVGEPIEEAPDAGIPDISAELRTAEEVAAEQVRAVLTSMLDRLGAAHHRPFSRA
jgi:hypothetical protein